jgi:hypothetical protein
MEAKSQAMLNTHTKLNFTVAYKECQKLWEQCIHSEADSFEGDGGK